MYFTFVVSKVLHCTLYLAEHFIFLQMQPWMLVILTCTQLVLLSISNVQGGSVVPATILGSSKRGADYWTITYKRSRTVVTHDDAPIACMSIVPTPPRPTLASPLAPNRSEIRLIGKRGPLKLDAFLRPRSPLAADETDAMQLTSETSPTKWPGPQRRRCAWRAMPEKPYQGVLPRYLMAKRRSRM